MQNKDNDNDINNRNYLQSSRNTDIEINLPKAEMNVNESINEINVHLKSESKDDIKVDKLDNGELIKKNLDKNGNGKANITNNNR